VDCAVSSRHDTEKEPDDGTIRSGWIDEGHGAIIAGDGIWEHESFTKIVIDNAGCLHAIPRELYPPSIANAVKVFSGRDSHVPLNEICFNG
jgi:hypothetical protein